MTGEPTHTTLTLLPLQIDSTLTVSMSVQSAMSMKSEFTRLNIQVSVPTSGDMGASTTDAHKCLVFSYP